MFSTFLVSLVQHLDVKTDYIDAPRGTATVACSFVLCSIFAACIALSFQAIPELLLMTQHSHKQSQVLPRSLYAFYSFIFCYPCTHSRPHCNFSIIWSCQQLPFPILDEDENKVGHLLFLLFFLQTASIHQRPWHCRMTDDSETLI